MELADSPSISLNHTKQKERCDMLLLFIVTGIMALAFAAAAGASQVKPAQRIALAVLAIVIVISSVTASMDAGKEAERSRVRLKPGQTAIILNEYFAPNSGPGYVAQTQDASREIFTFDFTRVVSNENSGLNDGGERYPEEGDIVVADKDQQVIVIGTISNKITENPPETP